MDIKKLFKKLEEEGEFNLLNELEDIKRKHVRFQWYTDSRMWEKEILKLCGKSELYNKIRSINREMAVIYPIEFWFRTANHTKITHEEYKFSEIYFYFIPRIYKKDSKEEIFEVDFMEQMEEENFGYACLLSETDGLFLKQIKEYELVDVELVPYTGGVFDEAMDKDIPLDFTAAEGILKANLGLFNSGGMEPVVYAEESEYVLRVELPKNPELIHKAVKEKTLKIDML